MTVRAGTTTARRLRRDQTEAEGLLWSVLRSRRLGGFKFRRQFPVDRYIADFACIEAHLIVELDGGQHAARLDHDAERTRVLEAAGFTVLRFWNDDVLKRFEAVQETILAALRAGRV